MERRTLLAVVLAALVMVGYQFIFGPQTRPTVDTATTGVESPVSDVAERTESPIPGSGDDAGITQDRESADTAAMPGVAFIDAGDSGVPIEVDTPLYLALLSPRGGALTKWELSRYTDKSDEPAELVSSAADGLLEFRVVEDEGVVDISRATFQSKVTTGPDGERVQLTARANNGLQCDLIYSFSESEYLTNLDILIDGASNRRGDGELQIIFPHTLPKLEKLEKFDDAAMASVVSIGGKKIREGARRKKDGWSKTEAGTIDWMAIRSKYFISALIPDGAVTGEVRFSKAAEDDIKTELSLPLATTGPTRYSFRLYSGPMELERLTALGSGLDRAVDLGWTWIRPFSRLLLRILNWLHEVIPNYGVAVLILSAAAKLAFYPLTRTSLKSMRRLQALKPEMDRINEQYKDDAQKKQQAIFDLYKENKVNPAGGCLPMLVQMPVFVALYQVLSNAIELRKEPFVLWIDDLSAPDAIGSIAGFPIHVLPVLMGITMFVQQKMTPTDPRQAALMYMMPVMMLFFFYSLPSGLVLYWTVSNLLQIGQQAMMNKEAMTQKAAA
ncbi:MAG: membrane protein insertase YidC [Candidatus Eisenbacteria bacterium]|uniref:Membrane protein insertase YidC n=1 Tax=Eiseniibacteriota bacterium TaxID=2212470 RepID=A0A956NF14_UNCEI|nr:membrane protein insertase YidC [Candidatus Eisenbacteria bacterium]MCB9465993.1 membrane protein insertase YidC [Candidatus Eisenbacteria bacterium]